MSAACLRGYVGIWEIEDGYLYLKGLDAWTYDRKADLKKMFPHAYKDGRVKATWFSGTLRLDTTESPETEPDCPQLVLHCKDGDLQHLPPGSFLEDPNLNPAVKMIWEQALARAPQARPTLMKKPRRQPDVSSEPSSKARAAFQEPSLSALQTDRAAEVYRFVWLRTFHHPVAVRIVLKNDGDEIVSKVLDGAGGYDLGKLIVNKSSPFSPQQKAEFNAMLESTEFWDLPATDPSRSGLDGATWTVEAVKDGEYHVVQRWSPNSGGVRSLGLFFLKAGNIDEERIY